jgi:hypothetical protein
VHKNRLLRLCSRVNGLFTQSRSAAGSRSIVAMMQEDGEQVCSPIDTRPTGSRFENFMY